MTENVNWNIIDKPYINVRFLKTHDDAILPKLITKPSVQVILDMIFFA